MSARNRLIHLVRYGIGVGVLVVMAVYIYHNRDEFAVIFSINAWNVVLLIGLAFAFGLVSAAQFASLYRALGAPVGIMESFFLSTLGGFFALVVPQATYLTKAVYLKQRYNLPYSKTPAIFLGSVVVFVIMGITIVGLSLAMLAVNGDALPGFAWLVIPLTLGIVFLWRLHIPDRVLVRLGRVGNMLRLFLEGWSTLRQDRRCLARISFYQLLMFVIAGMSFSVVFTSIGNNMSPLVGTVMAVSTSFSNLISLTPANLGIQEAVVGYLAQMAGHTFVEGVAGAALLRVVGLAITLITAPIAWYVLFGRRKIRITR